MARQRRRRHEERENHDRWLVSYADFITLLFAFFVLMYAISSLNEGKYRVLSSSLAGVFGPAQRPADLGAAPVIVDASGHARARRRAEEARAKAMVDAALAALADHVAAGTVRVTQGPRGVEIDIAAAALFATGEARVEPHAAALIASVARALAAVDAPLAIEGHTDDVPIATAQFPSNWELAGARAAAVVRLLAVNGVAPARLSAVGYADQRPVEPNATADGRARNRRVTVLVQTVPAESARIQVLR